MKKILRTVTIALLASTLAACGASAPRVAAAPTVPAEVAGEQTIYYGRVYPREGGGAQPTFVYERRVGEQNGTLYATHVTREPSGAAVLAETASHTDDYRLLQYSLLGDQLGRRGTVRVDGEKVLFRRIDASGEATTEETTSEPVVVGPTLVGFIARHLDALRAGGTETVRFAVLDRLETIGFELAAVAAAPGQTRVRMTASSPLFALLIDPVDFTFDARTGNLLHLEGRVPPKVRAGDEWADFDARVEYQYVAALYR